MSVVLGQATIFCDDCGGKVRTLVRDTRAARRAGIRMGWKVAEVTEGVVSGIRDHRDLCSSCREPNPDQPMLIGEDD